MADLGSSAQYSFGIPQYQAPQPQQQQPQAPIALPDGLADVDGVTSQFYEEWGALEQFVRGMNQMGVDVTNPNPSNPYEVQAAKQYMKALANVKAKGNELKNKQAFYNNFYNQWLTNPNVAYSGGIEQIETEGFDPLKAYNTGPTKQTESINQLGKGGFYLEKDKESFEQYGQAYMDQISQEADRAEQEGRYRDADRLRSQMINPTKKIPISFNSGQWNAGDKTLRWTQRRFELDNMRNIAYAQPERLTSLLQRREDYDSHKFFPTTGQVLIRFKDGSTKLLDLPDGSQGRDEAWNSYFNKAQANQEEITYAQTLNLDPNAMNAFVQTPANQSMYNSDLYGVTVDEQYAGYYPYKDPNTGETIKGGKDVLLDNLVDTKEGHDNREDFAERLEPYVENKTLNLPRGIKTKDGHMSSGFEVVTDIEETDEGFKIKAADGTLRYNFLLSTTKQIDDFIKMNRFGMNRDGSVTQWESKFGQNQGMLNPMQMKNAYDQMDMKYNKLATDRDTGVRVP